MSINDRQKIMQKEVVENAKRSILYKTMLDYFPDAELVDIKTSKEDDN